ncbi:RHS repeat-associated core domain-containing protein [Telluria beijingensis]|uniref:RHS repeat-associated core domain-containing protein n=1 Tax=Telluria beijingensis TaxID=3068633 RepID=UPI003BF4D9F3
MKYDPAGRLIEQQLGAIAQTGQTNRQVQRDTYRPDLQVGMRAAILRRYSYDPSGQLTSVEDNRRGRIEYRYDPIGRLLAASSVLGHETFAFDPAGNIQVAATTQYEPTTSRVQLPKLLNNLLKEYAGVSYSYDDRGNVVKRSQDGLHSEYEWDAFNRMTRATTWQGFTTFAYDPLGRRIVKHSKADGETLLRNTTQTMYGWDGDTLAWESSVHGGHAAMERAVHYVYERNSFVPLIQATQSRMIQLAPTTDVKALMVGNGGKYDPALDPLWNGEREQKAEPFGKDEISFFQCDHLGTPQEVTDCNGKVAWSAQYKAWGEAKEAISETALKTGKRNPIRFQGQYFDEETELHYNRHRYYDPVSGRFICKDPIGLLGGFNTHAYAPNPVQWVDPLGLAPKKKDSINNGCANCDPCQGRNPAAIARSWQGREPYDGVDSYINVVVKEGTVLYTLYPHGDAPGNYLVKSNVVRGAHTARQYNDAVQVAHKENWKSRDARPMRTKVHGYALTKDTCMAVSIAKNNPKLGKGGAKQYFIENRDKPNLLDTGRIIAYGS